VDTNLERDLQNFWVSRTSEERIRGGGSMRTFAFVLGLSMVFAVAPDPAEACLHGTYMNVAKATKMVGKAEQALTEGKIKKVLKILDPDSTYVNIGYFMFDIEEEKLHARALTILSVAMIRAGTKGEDLAAEYLAERLKEDTDDPWLAARVAEATVKVTGDDAKAEARKTLTGLAERDLMPDPEAWGMLSWLHLEAGDALGSLAAVERCSAMTERPGVCDPAAVAVSMAPKKKKKAKTAKAKKPAPDA